MSEAALACGEAEVLLRARYLGAQLERGSRDMEEHQRRMDEKLVRMGQLLCTLATLGEELIALGAHHPDL